MSPTVTTLLYTLAGFCFIMCLKGLSSQEGARTGNTYGILGMTIAILTTLLNVKFSGFFSITALIGLGGAVGYVIAKRIDMTSLPQLVAAFHSLVGLAAVAVAFAAFYAPASFHVQHSDGSIYFASLFEMSLGSIIGAITFTGSIVAFAKLQGLKWKDGLGGHHHKVCVIFALVLVLTFISLLVSQSASLFWALAFLSFVLGYLLIMPVGGADMPVIVSMLNSYSGWAAAGIGLTLNNYLLVITGALVGASGAILSYIMCKGMNRSLLNVMMGGFGTASSTKIKPENQTVEAAASTKEARIALPEEAAQILINAKDVIIVPGYGLAVAHAQHALHEIEEVLRKKGCRVRYAIHPVAGRMPGHMNVLLAEASVDYDDIFELEEINEAFSKADVALVIGANDITNPAAKSDQTSPIYGMPVLDVELAKKVLFVKRSLGAGYAGIHNPLFEKENTFMVLGDAKKVCEAISKAIN